MSTTSTLRPSEDRALSALAVVTRKLREARDEVARLNSVPPTTPVSGSVVVADPPNSRGPVPWENVEDDLRD